MLYSHESYFIHGSFNFIDLAITTKSVKVYSVSLTITEMREDA